jgi:excisionase family DNA binding protein
MNANTPAPLLIDDKAASALLGIGRSTLWRLLASGQLPRPVRLGRCVRWRRADLETWAAKGCPPACRDEASEGEAAT